MSALTEVRPKPLAEEFKDFHNWLHHLGLNRIFGAPLDESKAALTFALVRRTRDSVAAFDGGCFLLDLFIKSRAIEYYFGCLERFEASILWLSFATDISSKTLEVKVFQKGDGSAAERVRWLCNVIKHNDPMKIPPEHTNALWLENDGIHGAQMAGALEDRRKVTFGELRHEIKEFAKFADVLAAGGKEPEERGKR